MILKPEDPHQIFFASRADLVAGEEMVRVVDEVVGRLDLGPLYARWSEAGRGFYDPAMMLKVLFFAYSDGERHSRDIAKKIRYDIRYQYFAGTLRPKYRSICRFRVIAPELLAAYFVKIVRICHELGLVNNSLLAIDGTKLKASASRRQTLRRKDLDKLAERYRQMLSEDALIDGQELAEGDDSDDEPGQENSDSGRKAFSSLELKERVKAAIARLSEGESEVNLTDGDARFMKTSDGGIRPSYNAQVAVDKNQIIVAADVGRSADDGANLAPMIEQSRKNMESEFGKILTDGGYYSAANMKYIARENLDVYMPMGKSHRRYREKFGIEDFGYEESTDSYICPAGKELKYKCSRQRQGVERRIYSASLTKCKSCELRAQCTTGRKRELWVSAVWGQERAMQEKLQTQEGAFLYSRRKVMVEPVFGNMKFNMGFGRFLLRGLEKVKGEFLLMCIAHNLKKIAGRLSNPGPTLAFAYSQLIKINSILRLILPEFTKISIAHAKSARKLVFA
jgi:transposase